MHELSLHYLDRIARATEASATSDARTRREVRAMGRKLEELIGWARRLALLAALWGCGGMLHLSNDQIVDLLVSLLKR